MSGMHMPDNLGCFPQEEEARKTWVCANLTEKASSVAWFTQIGEAFQGRRGRLFKRISQEALAQATAAYCGDGLLLGENGLSGLLHRHRRQTHTNGAAAALGCLCIKEHGAQSGKAIY